jgi:16S rRNA (guanine966-N2)-methyltransferase
LRIIAGSSKGKALSSPIDLRTRPTSDRAREGLFSSLESEFGSITGLYFLDLFCGSGAVGVEALSRGAELVIAVDSDPVVSTIAMVNFSIVDGFERQSKVFSVPVEEYVKSVSRSSDYRFDIIFMDPPYDLANETIEQLLQAIDERQLLQPKGVIAVERRSKDFPFTWPVSMEGIKIRSYGQGSIYYGNYSASVLP